MPSLPHLSASLLSSGSLATRPIRAAGSAAALLCLFLAAFGVAPAFGQEQPPQGADTSIDIEALRQSSSFSWTQPELVFGFAHWDDVFPGRTIRRGARVHPLPLGSSLSHLSAGTKAGDLLDRFIAEEQVAGILVLHEGRVRLERYALGHSATGRWTSQSVAKSITSALVGAAVKDGHIASIHDPVTKYIPGLRGSAYDDVTVEQLMTMTSGVEWNEDYTDPDTDLARFYEEPVTPGLNATVSYMRRLSRESPPGTSWVYNTGETHLLGVLISSATGTPLARYLSEKIWASYGMEGNASWTLDRTDHELSGCCLQATLRDYARFGQFVLDGGRIDGEPVVPEEWFEAATRKNPAAAEAGVGYGYQWWITDDDDSFAAYGIHGQVIHIDPARRLVVVLNSAWPVATGTEKYETQDRMLALIRDAVAKERAP